MRLGAAWVPSPNAHYRALWPMTAMAVRGHKIVAGRDGRVDVELMSGCDLVHIYRRADGETWALVPELVRRGVPIIYDNDDDLSTLPEESPNYEEIAGHAFGATVGVGRQAQAMTTTNELLAERYRQAGIERVEVIGNYLAPGIARPRMAHDGIVIGWIASGEHFADTARIDIAAALRTVLRAHDQVRVECIGVDLQLPERYRHDLHVPFSELPGRIGGFDIGIAPLADIPWNWARSDIKLKEYAASGVPWLASPIGPYVGLGERQGGRLVDDDGWVDALAHLVVDHKDRRRLARSAEAWARTQTIDAVADQWERLFADVARPASVLR